MPAGPNYTELGRTDDDYSTWIFTYTEKNHLISEGTNELTAKLSCDIGPFNSTNSRFCKYHRYYVEKLEGHIP